MTSFFKAFSDRRMVVVMLLGFSSGLPLALTGSTLQAWMVTEKVDLTIIGIFSLVGLPYTLKFLWSPLMDRYIPPFLGRRRGWVLIMQLLLALSIGIMAFSHPREVPSLVAVIAFLVAFFSASQDIAIDAYKTEILHPEEYGLGAGVANMGYRVAMITSGAVALILADRFAWNKVYLLMAAIMLVSTLINFFAPEPKAQLPPQKLSDAVILPLVEFFKRKGVVEILIFIFLYKLDAVFAAALTTPFMLSLGFTKTDIGAVTKGFGLIATIVGTLVGGAFMLRIGMFRALLFFGILQGAAGLSFLALANMGHNYPMFITAITVENFCSGLGTSAYAAFIMLLCDKRYTATQFALLTSLMGLTRVLAGTPSGWIAKNYGWNVYFIISLLIAIPGLLMLLRYNVWMKSSKVETP